LRWGGGGNIDEPNGVVLASKGSNYSHAQEIDNYYRIDKLCSVVWCSVMWCVDVNERERTFHHAICACGNTGVIGTTDQPPYAPAMRFDGSQLGDLRTVHADPPVSLGSNNASEFLNPIGICFGVVVVVVIVVVVVVVVDVW